MNTRIRYENQPGIEVESISVLGSFYNYDPLKGMMHREEDGWVLEADLPPGEYCYKFLVNGSLLLNDPMANCYVTREEGGELWSFLRIGFLGQRLYNNTEYEVHLEDYLISGGLNAEGSVLRHRFSAGMDKRVAVRFGFRKVTGVHAVTVVWSDHTGQIKEYAEAVLCPEDTGQMAYLWFWLDLEQQKLGTWTMRLFVDGKYVLEDYFRLEAAFLYGADGQLARG